MTHPADKAIAEIESELPRYIQCKDLATVGFKAHVAILRVDYDRVMAEACALIRGGYVDGRARAVELAFDFTLRKAVGADWERTGEVNVNKSDRKVRALCVAVSGEAVGA